ncbi:MAG TPA: hypothetical protein VM901_00610 [Bdellovibrionota bacterium]|jgi:hypothetical protein|nr:hypothetical protein [Bdellovibrionota bacterium]
MKSLLWHGGKLLQLIALTQVGYALVVGLTTNDSRRETELLVLGAAQFLVGLVLVRFSSGGQE